MASAFQKKPKVFIMGLSSLLGYHLAKQLRHKFTVVGCYFSNPVYLQDVHAYPISLKNDTEMLERLVAIQRADFAITTVGITDPTILLENPKLAENINVMLPLSFALMCSRNRTKHIFMNSADVFDGSSGNYDEGSKDFSVLSGYGKMKITAEAYIRAQTMEGTTIRAGRVLALGHPYRHGFLDELRARLSQGKAFAVDETKINSYLTPKSLANAMEKILESPFPGNKQRLFHVGGPTANELEISQVLSAALGLDPKYLKLAAQSTNTNLSLNSELMESTFAWKQETKEQLIKNITHELKPGLNRSSKSLRVATKTSAAR